MCCVLNIIYDILNILYKESDFKNFNFKMESMAIARNEHIK